MGTQNEPKRFFRTEAAGGGLILGGVLAAILALSYGLDLYNKVSWAPGLLNFLAIVWITYARGRKLSVLAGREEPLSFGTVFGFMLLMLVFAGIIYGFGNYILQGLIDPEYFSRIIRDAYVAQGIAPEKAEEAVTEITGVQGNPLAMVFGNVLVLVLTGGLVSLVTAALARRPVRRSPHHDNTPSK